MNHLVVDLDTNIKTLLLHDDTIIDVRELVCTVDIFDKLHTMLQMLDVNKVTFITHNTMSACLYESCCVAYSMQTTNGHLLSSINTADVESLLQLCESVNIFDVQFVDKAGYYVALGRKGVCYVEKHLGMYHLFSVDEAGVTAYAISTEQSYPQRIDKFKENNRLSEVVFEHELVDIDNLMFFTNSAMLLDDEKAVHDLSVFAYACLEQGVYRYDRSVLERSTKNIQLCELGEPENDHVSSIIENVVDTTEPEEPDLIGDDTAEVDMLSEVHESSAAPIKRPFFDRLNSKPVSQSITVSNKMSLVASLVLVFGLVATGITIASFGVLKNTQDKIVKVEKELEYNQSLIASINSTIDAYEICINSDINETISMYQNLESSMLDCNGSVQEMCYTQENAFLNVSVVVEEDARKFILACTELGYSANCDKLTISGDATGFVQDSEDKREESGDSESDSSGEVGTGAYIIVVKEV